MRVTTQGTFDAIKNQLTQTAEDLAKANAVVSSGKRISKLSDDPIGVVQVLSLKESLSNMDQLSRNISTAQNWLNVGETALGSVKTTITDMKTLCVQMANGTMDASDRSNAAAQVEGALEQVVSLANTQVNGQYLFAGTNTAIQPFEIQKDANGNPTGVAYSGNDASFNVKIGKNTSVQVGQSGQAVFGDQKLTIDGTDNKIDFQEDPGTGFGAELTATIPSGSYTPDQLAGAIGAAMTTASGNGVAYTVTYDADTKEFTIKNGSGSVDTKILWSSGTNAGTNPASDLGFDTASDTTIAAGSSDTGVSTQWGIFKTLIDLKGYLENNDVAGIQQSMTALDADLDQVSSAVSGIGAKGVQLDTKNTILQNMQVSYQTRQSSLEDADMISAVSDVTLKQTAYQAALASSAKVMQVSLLDYL
jgi:flagellar hook-associated protein 3